MKKSMEHTLPFLAVQKSGAACLSRPQITVAAESQEGRARFSVHLEACGHCTDRVQREAGLRQEDAKQAVPASLFIELERAGQAKRRSFWPMLSSFALVAGVACAVFVFNAAEAPILRDDDSPMLKGQPSLLVSVQRSGALVVKDADMQNLGALQVGDQVRFRVAGSTHGQTTASVDVHEGANVTKMFNGLVPDGGLLPVALEVTPGDKARVEIAVCVSPSSCQTSLLEF